MEIFSLCIAGICEHVEEQWKIYDELDEELPDLVDEISEYTDLYDELPF